MALTVKVAEKKKNTRRNQATKTVGLKPQTTHSFLEEKTRKEKKMFPSSIDKNNSYHDAILMKARATLLAGCNSNNTSTSAPTSTVALRQPIMTATPGCYSNNLNLKDLAGSDLTSSFPLAYQVTLLKALLGNDDNNNNNNNNNNYAETGNSSAPFPAYSLTQAITAAVVSAENGHANGPLLELLLKIARNTSASSSLTNNDAGASVPPTGSSNSTTTHLTPNPSAQMPATQTHYRQVSICGPNVAQLIDIDNDANNHKKNKRKKGNKNTTTVSKKKKVTTMATVLPCAVTAQRRPCFPISDMLRTRGSCEAPVVTMPKTGPDDIAMVQKNTTSSRSINSNKIPSLEEKEREAARALISAAFSGVPPSPSAASARAIDECSVSSVSSHDSNAPKFPLKKRRVVSVDSNRLEPRTTTAGVISGKKKHVGFPLPPVLEDERMVSISYSKSNVTRFQTNWNTVCKNLLMNKQSTLSPEQQKQQQQFVKDVFVRSLGKSL